MLKNNTLSLLPSFLMQYLYSVSIAEKGPEINKDQRNTEYQSGLSFCFSKEAKAKEFALFAKKKTMFLFIFVFVLIFKDHFFFQEKQHFFNAFLS